MPADKQSWARRSYAELRKANQKAAAILVALVLCAALEAHEPSVPARLATACFAYTATHLGAVLFVGSLHGKVFEQLTMLCAELVAFLWRDTCHASFQAFTGGYGHPHLWSVAWAAVMLLFGSVWLRLAHHLRGRCKTNERTSEAMLDVEADACGLSVGQPLFVTAVALYWGEAWPEQIDEPDGAFTDMMFFGVAGLLSICAAALTLRILECKGFDLEWPQVKALSSGWGFLIAFLMDYFILMLLLGPLHALFEIEVGEDGETMSVGTIMYPFVVMAVGALLISYHVHKAKPWSRWWDKVFIWSYQIGVALAFETLLDEVVDILEEDQTTAARLAIAAAFVAAWAILCIFWAYLCHKSGHDEPAALPAEVGTDIGAKLHHDAKSCSSGEDEGQRSGKLDEVTACEAQHANEGSEVGEDKEELAGKLGGVREEARADKLGDPVDILPTSSQISKAQRQDYEAESTRTESPRCLCLPSCS